MPQARGSIKKSYPKITTVESGGDANKKEQLVKAVPIKKPVAETSKEASDEEERNPVDNGEARSKVSSRDSTSSDEATQTTALKAKSGRRKKNTRSIQAEAKKLQQRKNQVTLVTCTQ